MSGPAAAAEKAVPVAATAPDAPPAPAGPLVVIDDDGAMRLSCRQILERAGHAVETFGDGAQGLAAVARLQPPLVIVDLKMPGLSGFDVLRRLRELDPTLVVVVITGYATVETAIEAMKAGAYDFLAKPFSPDQLRLLVARGLERRRMQRESSRLALEREVLRRRFVSLVSHQLKSPLASIHQYLDVMQRLAGGPEDEARRGQWIERCLELTREMRLLIDDWLTLSRVEAGTLARTREAVELAPLLEGLAEAHEEAARRLGVTVEVTPPATPCAVAGDPAGLAVLFENLLDNAVKYNRQGGTVTVAARSEAGEAVVEVRDTGAGIAEEARPFLFDEFYRGEAARAGTVAGTGLGLAICRRIARELGGTIEVDSAVGVGSTFRVRLPLAAGPASGAAPVPPQGREEAAGPDPPGRP